MYWIYILRCKDNIYYVGQTSRLYRRFWEHLSGRGGINTSIYKPEEIVAIYKVSNITKFIDYNNHVKKITDGICHDKYNSFKLKNYDDELLYDIDLLEIENSITECMMIHNKDNWENIRGGKYVRLDCLYKFPTNEYIKELPLCNCGLPCDVKKDQNKESLFFRCAKKNMWNAFKDIFEIEDEPCNFYKEYLTDIELRVEDKKNFNERKKKLRELLKQSDWLKNVPCEEEGVLGECVSCNTYVWSDRQGEFKNNGITYCNDRRLLCFNCFIDKNEELNKKYNICNSGNCLISL